MTEEKKDIKLSLAPMAGYTDSIFRRICSENGADYCTSEMISSIAMVMGDEKTAGLARINEGEAPVYLQLFGHEPKIMAQAAEKLLSRDFRGCEYYADPVGIDINMGCPVKKIVSSHDGSAMMLDIPNAVENAKAVLEVCEKYGRNFSVKIRAGWDSGSVNAPDMAFELCRAGVRRITVHDRTREQMYGPGADRGVIRAVCGAVNGFGCTVVGNGDIMSYDDAVSMCRETGCHEAAIGRAALGNPWVFRKDGYVPTEDDIIQTACRIIDDVVIHKGELSGVHEARGRAAYLIRGRRGSAKIRDSLNHCDTAAEFKRILYTLKTDENYMTDKAE